MPVTKSHKSAPSSGDAIPGQKIFNSEVINISSDDETASNNTSASPTPCTNPPIETREPAETVAGQMNPELSRQQFDDEIPDSAEDSDDGELRADANTDTETNKASKLTTEGERDGPRGRIAVGNMPPNKRKASIEPSEQNEPSTEDRQKRPRYSVKMAFRTNPPIVDDGRPPPRDEVSGS
ncbi:hypothetical protein G3M48_000754 [Beauveria asiatica]|uniref:Uncharacterized protein n=1 Tax=Beauveria asiatica TaxID=1069075 RepID=A0AAW0S0W9_9HYPO